MHPVPGVRYGRYTARLREVLVWTCKLHDEPPHYDDYHDAWYDGDGYDIDFNFPQFGCTCERGAKWKGTGVWEYYMEPDVARILREVYMPPIVEMLNSESVFLKALEKE